MKKIIVVLAATLISGIASADIAIAFSNSGGIVFKEDGSGVVDQSLVQLIWAEAYPSAQAGVGGALGAGEIELDSFITGSGTAGTWGTLGPETYLNTVYQENLNAGYFFVRMFDNGMTEIGDAYLQLHEVSWVTGSLVDPSGDPPPLPYNTDGFLGGSLVAGSDNLNVIPEPAVAGLISIFGGGMLVARRLFSKS